MAIKREKMKKNTGMESLYDVRLEKKIEELKDTIIPLIFGIKAISMLRIVKFVLIAYCFGGLE